METKWETMHVLSGQEWLTRDHAREMSGRNSEVAGPTMMSKHRKPCQARGGTMGVVTLNVDAMCDDIEHRRRVALGARRRIAVSLEDEVKTEVRGLDRT